MGFSPQPVGSMELNLLLDRPSWKGECVEEDP